MPTTFPTKRRIRCSAPQSNFLQSPHLALLHSGSSPLPKYRSPVAILCSRRRTHVGLRSSVLQRAPKMCSFLLHFEWFSGASDPPTVIDFANPTPRDTKQYHFAPRPTTSSKLKGKNRSLIRRLVGLAKKRPGPSFEEPGQKPGNVLLSRDLTSYYHQLLGA